MKRVLIAGATGYLGGFVAREFKDRGYFVRALARSPKKLDHLWDSMDEIVEGELLAFFTTMATNDVVAPSTGRHTLEECFRGLQMSAGDHPGNDKERLSDDKAALTNPPPTGKGAHSKC
jgi:uncharacterized protein YbjT (DUF2867 family)